jgi:hypothetical protein
LGVGVGVDVAGSAVGEAEADSGEAGIGSVGSAASVGGADTAGVEACPVVQAARRVIVKKRKSRFRFMFYLQFVWIASAIVSASRASPEGVRWMALLVNSFSGARSHKSR